MTIDGPTIEILTDVLGIERSYCTMLSVFQVVHATMDMFLGLGTFRSSCLLAVEPCAMVEQS